jgi:hypothetical protein
MLTEAQAESIERIATHCARSHKYTMHSLPVAERREAALTGIVEEITENGYPVDPGAHQLFRSALNAIDREERENAKHLRNWAHWIEPRGFNNDPMDFIIERIAVWQVCWAMTDVEWSGVWALAEAYRRGGGIPMAAAILGVKEASLIGYLVMARKRARGLWIAPGDHASGMYRPNRNGVETRLQTWHGNQRRATIRRTEDA